MTVELRTGDGDVTSLDQTTLLATATSEGNSLTLSPETTVPEDGKQGVSRDLPKPADRVLVWITGLPMPDAATVGEITVHGAPVVKGDRTGSAVAPAPTE
jgi:putative peptidoglycan lipid II flippase